MHTRINVVVLCDGILGTPAAAHFSGTLGTPVHSATASTLPCPSGPVEAPSGFFFLFHTHQTSPYIHKNTVQLVCTACSRLLQVQQVSGLLAVACCAHKRIILQLQML